MQRVQRQRIAIACLGLLGLLGCATDPAAGTAEQQPDLPAASGPPPHVVDLDGRELEPLAETGHVQVFLFVRSDCPISNRYAPEVRRIAERFASRGVELWLVYADPDEPLETIRRHLAEYGHPGRPVRDPRHELVRRTGATVTPEAAVFSASGELVYVGRIDDRFVDFGKARAAPTRNDLIEALEATLAGHPVSEPRTRAVGCFIPQLQTASPSQAR